MDDIERFKQRLIDKENPPNKTEEATKLLSDYYDFLQTKNKNFNSINSEDFYEFSKTLIDQEKSIGEHKVVFNESYLSSGIYFYQMRTDEFIQTNKMILLR